MRTYRYGQIGHPFAQILAKNQRFLMLFGLVLVFFGTSFFTKNGPGGGSISAGELRLQTCIYASLPNFDFDAKCKITGYTVTRLPKRGDPFEWQNNGDMFSVETRGELAKIKSGDRIFFDDIKCLCPGDPAQRNIGGLAFLIK